MQQSPPPSDSAVAIDVLIFDQFSNHCLANCMEPFRAANDLGGRQRYAWRFLTLDGEPVRSSSRLMVTPDHRLGPTDRGDYLFVMSSYGHQMLDTAATRRALQAARRRYRVIVGLDTAPWLLAAAGLLDGHRATIHWDEFDHFSEVFADLDIARARYVIDGSVATCGGAMAAFDLSLELIARLNGAALALDVSGLFTPGRETAALPAPTVPCTEPLVARAVEIMRQNLEDPLSIPAIASRIGCGGKRLQRLFEADLGATPIRIYRHLRLSYARHLVDGTRLGLDEIQLRAGYGDASAFARAFKARFGVPPRAYRAGAGRQSGKPASSA